MKVDIFIRTYKGDIEWLKYCLKSIQKYCTGFNQLIIAIPQSQLHYLSPLNITNAKIVTVPDYANDYLGQQVSKLMAYEHSDAEFILFTDSDCVFNQPVTPETYITNYIPQMLKTPYEEVGNAIMWKDITEKALGLKVKYEYMRRMPLVYKRYTLKGISFWFKTNKGESIESYVMRQNGREFSEFNIMGAYADYYEKSEYNFTDTSKNPLPELTTRQFWSWSGLTENDRKELEAIIG